MPEENELKDKNKDFIRTIIDQDLANNKNSGKVETRFPPEPNGYLHIGHAKSICLNFGIARDYKGICHLRFDDTNPEKEDVEYTDSIQEDVKWLGFDWGKHIYYASDYYDKCYEYAIELIKKGKAYVCDLSPDEVRLYRGTPTEPGKNSPYRKQAGRRKFGVIYKDEKRRIQGRRQDPACKDRYGAPEHKYERSCTLQDKVRRTPQDRQKMVYLSVV